MDPPFKMPEFSLEENKGRFLDIHGLYIQLINIKSIAELGKLGDYLWYLQNFDQFEQIPLQAKHKAGGRYLAYLTALQNYLHSFLCKVQPLQDFSSLLDTLHEECDNLAKSGQLASYNRLLQLQESLIFC
jgi:splicing factor 3A subunit 3